MGGEAVTVDNEAEGTEEVASCGGLLEGRICRAAVVGAVLAGTRAARACVAGVGRVAGRIFAFVTPVGPETAGMELFTGALGSAASPSTLTTVPIEVVVGGRAGGARVKASPAITGGSIAFSV